MTKTLKYKRLKKRNQTRKMRGGLKFNLFGNNSKNQDNLPFMYFYNLIKNKKSDEEKSEPSAPPLTAEELKET